MDRYDRATPGKARTGRRVVLARCSHARLEEMGGRHRPPYTASYTVWRLSRVWTPCAYCGANTIIGPGGRFELDWSPDEPVDQTTKHDA